jgi:hypothetical protein
MPVRSLINEPGILSGVTLLELTKICPMYSEEADSVLIIVTRK